MESISDNKKTIVITGFGLFRDHKLNPSWEAIKDDKIKTDRSNLRIITKQIDVSYQAVDEKVTKLWNYYKPVLMVHIGLSAIENCIRIEEMARQGPYINDDVRQFAPHKHLRQYSEEKQYSEEGVIKHKYGCKPCEFNCSKTSLNVDKICDKMNELYEKGKLSLPTKKSSDAGLYVCEYIYQHSLNICNQDEAKKGYCLFIHVPDTKNFDLNDITASIQEMINIIIDLYFPLES